MVFLSSLILLASSIGAARAEEGAPTPPAPVKPAVFGVEKVESAGAEGTKFSFSIPDGMEAIPPLKLPVWEAESVGVIPNDGNPWVLVAGMPCETCKNNKSLLLARANGGKVSNGSAIVIHYPGTVTERETGAVLHRSRAFYGKCLPSKGEGIVIFQEEKVNKRKFLQHAVFVAEITGDKLREELIASRRLPAISNSLRLVKGKKCFEIPGVARSSVKFPE
jgi:hypothetical protein